jgi:hypothetical protein
MGRDLNRILCSAGKKLIGGTPLEHPPYSPDLTPMRFLGFSNHEKGAPRQEISKWSTVCNTFSRSGWSVVRSASLPKAGASKKRPSPHLHKVPTRSNKVSPRTFQTALVFYLYPGMCDYFIDIELSGDGYNITNRSWSWFRFILAYPEGINFHSGSGIQCILYEDNPRQIDHSVQLLSGIN